MRASLTALEAERAAGKRDIAASTEAQKEAQLAAQRANEMAENLSKRVKAKEGEIGELQAKLGAAQDSIRALEAARRARVAPQPIELHKDSALSIVDKSREMSGRPLLEADADFQKGVVRYTSAQELWTTLTPVSFKGKREPPLVLISAKWVTPRPIAIETRVTGTVMLLPSSAALLLLLQHCCYGCCY